MRRFGCALAAVVAIVAGALIFILAGSGPQGVAQEFLVALANQDGKTLVKTSYLEGLTDDQALQQWQKTLDRTLYYRFTWRIKSAVVSSDNSASVALDFYRNASRSSGYAENYALPLVKVDGKWKVDVRQINRTMYPALPR